MKAYAEAQDAQKSLQFAFSKFPALADTNQKSLQKLNSELQKKTRFDDDNIASGQAVLAQFKLTGAQLKETTPLLLDYASKTGKDIPGAARDVGKALLGNAKALKNIGISYKSTGDQQKDFTNITALMREKVGGFANLEGKTASGRLAILKNQFGELQESAGKQLLPALESLSNGALRLVGFVGKLSPVFGAFKRVAGAALGSLVESLGLGHASFKNFGDFILTHQADITTGFIKVAKAALGIGKGILTAASIGLRGFAMIMDSQTVMTALSLLQFKKLLEGASAAFGWIPDIGPKLAVANAKFAVFAGSAVRGMKGAADGARSAADGIDNKLKPALDKAGVAMDAVAKKEIVKAATRDAVRKAALAIQGIGTDANGAQVKLKTFADRSKLAADQQKGLNGRIIDAKRALRDQISVMRDAGAGQDKLSAAWRKGKDRLYDEFRQMGLSRAEAKRLAAQYAGIKPKVRTEFDTPGLGPARRDTRDFDKKIEGIFGKSVGVKVKYSHSGSVALDKLTKFFTGADGGVMPGYTPGRDVHQFVSATGGVLNLSGGEAVMRPEWTRAVGGPGAVARMNSDARSGRMQSFGGGGTVRVGFSNNTPFNSSSHYAAAYDQAVHIARAGALAAAKAIAAHEVRRQKKAMESGGGGPVGKGGYAHALSYARAHRGHPYWYGTLWDCSGFMSALHSIILGQSPHRRYSTTAFHGSHAAGFTRGKRSPFMVGVNPSPGKFGHMAGTLNGVNVESSGGVGVRVGGGARGHNSGMFSWRGGLANGGVIGDLPYDLLDPRGQRYNPDVAALYYATKRDEGGILRPGQAGVNRSGQDERVLSGAQTRTFDRMVRVMDRGGGAVRVENHYHFPNYVGDKADLKRALVDLDRRNELSVLKRTR